MYVDILFTARESTPYRHLTLDWHMRYKYSNDIVHEVNALASTALTTKYSDILAVDRKIREFKLPSHLTVLGDPESWESLGPKTVMCRFMVSTVRDIC